MLGEGAGEPVTAQVIRMQPPPRMQSRQASGTIRYSEDTRWGELTGEGLTGVISRAKKGDTSDWAELCLFAQRLFSDLPTTRVDRVLQGERIIRPPKGSERDDVAVFAAELVARLIPRIEYFEDSQRQLLNNALGIGFGAQEMDLQFDPRQRMYYCKRLMFVHPSRFAFDEQRVIRLYDRGARRNTASQWGEQLLPHKWIVHYHQEIPDYPGATGIMLPCMWPWMLWRWVEKFWVHGEERFGQPFIHGKVAPNTPEQVRDQILEDLQSFTSEHVAVFENLNEVQMLEAAAATHEGKKVYCDQKYAEIQRKWLGASDITDPGEHGSQSAVSTRGAMVTDPRMVTDGKRFWETMRHTLFKALCYWNLHLFEDRFGGTFEIDDVTLPECRLKTADDEVSRDVSQKQQEQRDEQQSADGDADVEGDAETEAPPDPKAVAPAPGQTSRRRKTSAPSQPTSTRSRSPFATTLRKG